jgi:hypothetical protein
MPLAPAATVLDDFPETLAVVLRAQGIADNIIARELAKTAEQRLAKTNCEARQSPRRRYHLVS